MRRRTFLQLGTSTLAGLLAGCRLGDVSGPRYAGWKPGEFDIHFIHTGEGEQTFFMFPDGTTMLLDCGEPHRRPAYVEAIPPLPNASRAPGEWVRRYLERVTDRSEIDYLMISHWHDDHVAGIPDVGRTFKFKTLLCHQNSQNRFQYRNDVSPMCDGFVKDWIPEACAAGMKEEAFRVGALNQIGLRSNAGGEYGRLFEIHNIAANGVVWDGRSSVRDCAAEHVRVARKGKIAENKLSAAIRIRYGRFSCYFGGDVSGEFKAADGTPYSYEGLVGSVVGPVDVCKTNHHAYWDAMKEPFVKAVRPRVFLSSTWSPNQINDRNLPIMMSRELYAGDRRIFHGFLPEAKRREYAGQPFMADFSPVQGHTVVKVEPGGDSYTVFVLDASDESMRILHQEHFLSRGQA